MLLFINTLLLNNELKVQESDVNLPAGRQVKLNKA